MNVMKKLLCVLFVMVLAVSCTEYKKGNDNQSRDQKVVQEYYQKLSEKVPYPVEKMKDSVERRNLVERLLRFNQPEKIGYVYLMTQTGETIGFFTIKGKVSSLQSQLTTASQVTYICQPKPFLPANADINRVDNQVCDWATTQSPSDDGSYGENETGIFFFTTEDVYVSWNGIYLYSDAPMNINDVTHKITVPDGAKPSSVGTPVDERNGK